MLQRHMPPQAEVQKLVLVSIEDCETIELIREFLEPLGYTVQYASETPLLEMSAS
jgi:CheY-like chemotaxis protein